MAKLIIYTTGRPFITGFKNGPFVWDESVKLYLYESKRFSEHEFNEVAPKILADYSHLHPMVKVIEFTPEPKKGHVAGDPITVDEAEEILREQAPELLKKKAGRKPVAKAA